MTKIQKKALLEGLTIVKPGLANKEMIEQSTSFAFMEDRVVTYNDEISISHKIPELGVTGAVKAEELYQLLSKFKQDEIDVQVTDNTSELVLACGKAKAGLVLQSEIKLPLEEIKQVGKWYPIPENLIEAMKFCSFSCSKDFSMPVLTCVHVRSDGWVEGAESWRATKYKVKTAVPVDNFLITATVVQDLAKYNFTDMSRSKGWLHFRNDKTIVSCRVFEEKYPDFEKKKLFEVKGKKFTLPKNIGLILERAGIFAKRDHALDEEIQVTIKDNMIYIKGQSDVGWLEEQSRVRYTGDPISFLINPNFLKDIVEYLQECTIDDKKIKFIGENWEHVLALRSE